MIDPDHKRLSIRRQCELVSISRASFYRLPAGETPENLELMRFIDEAFMEMPWYGSRQMARHLRRQGRSRRRQAGPAAHAHDRPVAALPGAEDQRAASATPHLSLPGLRHLAIERPDQVWCADVTYILMRRGFLYLVAVMDWFSCKVLAWRLSNIEPWTATGSRAMARGCRLLCHRSRRGDRPPRQARHLQHG